MRLPVARATNAIVAVTVAAFALAWVSGAAASIAPLAGFIPARVALDLAIPGAVPLWATPLTATLVHGGIAHLAFNLVILWFCGRMTEAALGSAGIVVLYVVGAYAAAAAQYLANPLGMVPMIGASGAVSAVIGAYALLFGQRRFSGWGPRSALAIHVVWLAAAWVGFQLLIGIATSGLPGVPRGSTVATAAHVGGFLIGLALARPLLRYRNRGA